MLYSCSSRNSLGCELLLQQLLQHLPVSAALLDREGCYVAVSQQWLQDHALEEQDILGRSHFCFFPDATSIWSNLCDRCLEGHTETWEEYHTSSEVYRWQQWQARAWQNEAGEMEGLLLTSRDITDQKQATRDLAASEARLREMAANLPGAIFQFTNRDGLWTVDYISEGILELSGISAEVMMQDFNQFVQLVHPEDLNDYLSSVIQVLETPAPWRYEGRLIRADGEIRWWQGSSDPIVNSQGHTIFCGVLLDITDRKLAELALYDANAALESRVEERTAELQQAIALLEQENSDRRRAEDSLLRYKQAVESCNDAIGMADAEGNHIYQNAAFSKLYEADSVEAFNAAGGIGGAFVDPQQGLEIIQTLRRGDNWSGEVEQTTCTGRIIETFFRASAVKDTQGKIVGLMGVFSDVTERRQAEAALRESEERLRSVNTFVPGAIYQYETRLATGESWFSYLSPKAAEIFEIEPEHLLDCAPILWQRIHPEDAPRLIASTNRAIYESIVWSDEFRVILPSGREKWISGRSEPAETVDGVARQNGVFVDISDRKRAELELREREQTYRQILDAIGDYVLIKGPESRILMANKAFRDYYNMTAEELKSIVDAPFNPPDYTQQYIRDDAFVFNTGQILQIPEEPVTRHDGVVRLWHTIKSPVFNLAGEVVMTVGISRDITERKQAEEILRQKEAQYRSIFEAVNDGIAIFDLETGNQITCNPAHAKIHGYTPEEFMQLSPQDYIHPDSWHLFQQTLIMVRAGQQVSCQAVDVHKNGSTFDVEVVVTPYLHEGRVCALAVLRDISDRKRAELAIQQSKKQLEEAQRLAHIGSWDFDCSTGHINWSDEVFRIHGLPVSDQAPSYEGFLSLHHSDDRPFFEAVIQRALTHAEAYDVEDRLITPDGILRYVNSKGEAVCNAEGQVVRLFGTIMDITERKLAEHALRQSEAELRQQALQLEQALRELQHTQSQLVQTEKMSSLGQLVAGVAHEINNPVNFIYGNLSHADEYIQDLLQLLCLYRQHYPNPHPEIAQEADNIDVDFLTLDLPKLLASMKVGADRIRGIVQALRSFSRMDEAALKSVNIHDGLDSTLMILQHRLKETSLFQEIRVTREYSELPLLECYAGQLNQVFMNIFSNAIDALDSSGKRDKTSAEAPTLSVQTSLTDSSIQIRIMDNGSGIPEEVRQRIFEPFFTTKEVGKGTGLGLSISYQVIVDKHKGSLTCQSTSDQGTQFIIELPRSR
ncbi:PAS domain S-box protein [Geitlerinema sp. PCC 7407]|uniref:PAS domain S-box protein n=1 Tax=Geitlerinema sp. PCC 7407 TaxID=1173025 RepID=UPI00029FF764|nr:PAS/PAC sensor signal transduction histidine kinase [Geitlerinema sp. PCC 7407]